MLLNNKRCQRFLLVSLISLNYIVYYIDELDNWNCFAFVELSK